MTALTDVEQAFLTRGSGTLARIATVDADGLPHVVPGGWRWDVDAEELVLTGRDVRGSARASHVRSSGVAAVTIDGIVEGATWSPWAFLARGPARLDEVEGTIRLSPRWHRSWGLEGQDRTPG